MIILCFIFTAAIIVTLICLYRTRGNCYKVLRYGPYVTGGKVFWHNLSLCYPNLRFLFCETIVLTRSL